MEATHVKKETYLVEGMTGSGCERTVKKVVENIQGVKSAKAELTSATVSVEYDPSKITIDHIKSAIGKVGYRFAGEHPSAGHREESDEAIS